MKILLRIIGWIIRFLLFTGLVITEHALLLSLEITRFLKVKVSLK